MGRGSDAYASQTATDWVSQADHVAVLSVLSEKELPPTQEEQAAGEGLIGREITVRVDKILWSSPNPAHPAPSDTFSWTADGWSFQGEERTAFTMAGSPRYEPGHTYIEALKWEPEHRDEDDITPAQWVGLGEGSSLPYDGGVIGKGEYQGETVSASSFKSMEDDSAQGSLEEQMAGKTASDLIAALNAARPTTPPST
ncbi:hypothetical protein [Streptomyces chartreusis]|uniref:hypothetical protein n=1 Tax=Streptomyces chartreusis TaxID=1969 RepID=UPI00379EC5CD